MITVTIYSAHGRVMSTCTVGSEQEAKKVAAHRLGKNSLRGCRAWDRYQGGRVYQFGAGDRMHAVIQRDGDDGFGVSR
jgi:hypothetical protein